MQSESKSEYLRTCNNYFDILNKVNLLLVEEHFYVSEMEIYQKEVLTIEALIKQIQNPSPEKPSISACQQHQHLQSIIRRNKADIETLEQKLETKQKLLSELQSLQKNEKSKYMKLISSEYQSALQQKLSVIRGNVDDLKKKIKEINKEINGFEQEHKLMMDEYSCQQSYLRDIQGRNEALRKQIEQLEARADPTSQSGQLQK